MYISKIEIENFRCFGEGDQKFVLPLSPGLTALLGENDSGKTAVIDALRFIFGTRDQEYYRVQDSDFHWPAGGAERRKEIRVCCRLDGLTLKEQGAFAEFLTYVDEGGKPDVALYVHWTAKDKNGARSGRRMVFSEVRTGRNGNGPALDVEARDLLHATYLRPLRDAERALAAGRGSRLSEILRSTKDVTDVGTDYDPAVNPAPNVDDLSVLGIGDYTSALIGDHEGIRQARNTLNETYLKPLSFAGDDLEGQISVGRQGDSDVRLRQLLERLELELQSGTVEHKNLALDALQKLLNGEIRSRAKRNIVQSKAFSQRLEEAVARYHANAISTVEMIQQLIDLAKDIKASADRGGEEGLSDDEMAFYDALAQNESAVDVMGNEQLRVIAHELLESMKSNVTVDWHKKESARAKMRILVHRILKKFGYPPDLAKEAVRMVIAQAEAVLAEVA